MKEILFKEESAKIVGAIFEVHKRLGVGLLEKDSQFKPYVVFDNFVF